MNDRPDTDTPNEATEAEDVPQPPDDSGATDDVEVMVDAEPVETVAAADQAETAETAEPVEAPADVEPGAAAEPAVQAEAVQPPRGLELYFLRHADAGDPAQWPGDDADRPLSGKGRRQAKKLGRLLDELRVKPDVLVTSPKVRAADTARLVGRSIAVKPTTDERLSGGLDAGELGELLEGLAPDVRRVMLVGHDPDFSSLVTWLVGSPLSLRKGALARTDLPDRTVGAGRASLRWLIPPDAVPG